MTVSPLFVSAVCLRCLSSPVRVTLDVTAGKTPRNQLRLRARATIIYPYVASKIIASASSIAPPFTPFIKLPFAANAARTAGAALLSPLAHRRRRRRRGLTASRRRR